VFVTGIFEAEVQRDDRRLHATSYNEYTQAHARLTSRRPNGQRTPDEVPFLLCPLASKVT
jgi:hypothetical protein